jgi:hypothetical protein
MEGWVKLHRKILKWEWFQDDKTFRVFLYLLLSANHKDKKWKGIDVKRGQIITGRMSIAESVGISERSVRTCLIRLKTTNELTIKTTNKYSLITINKYEEYQINGDANDQQNDQQISQQTTNKRPTNDHNQEYKEDKNKEKEEEKEILILKKSEEEEYEKWRIENANKTNKFFDEVEEREKQPPEIDF